MFSRLRKASDAIHMRPHTGNGDVWRKGDAESGDQRLESGKRAKQVNVAGQSSSTPDDCGSTTTARLALASSRTGSRWGKMIATSSGETSEQSDFPVAHEPGPSAKSPQRSLASRKASRWGKFLGGVDRIDVEKVPLKIAETESANIEVKPDNGKTTTMVVSRWGQTDDESTQEKQDETDGGKQQHRVSSTGEISSLDSGLPTSKDSKSSGASTSTQQSLQIPTNSGLSTPEALNILQGLVEIKKELRHDMLVIYKKIETIDVKISTIMNVVSTESTKETTQPLLEREPSWDLSDFTSSLSQSFLAKAASPPTHQNLPGQHHTYASSSDSQVKVPITSFSKSGTKSRLINAGAKHGKKSGSTALKDMNPSTSQESTGDILAMMETEIAEQTSDGQKDSNDDDLFY